MLGFLKRALDEFGCPDSRAVFEYSSGLYCLSLYLCSETHCLGDTQEAVSPACTLGFASVKWVNKIPSHRAVVRVS